MKRMLTLIAVARSGAHRVVFRDFADGLARIIRRRQGTARVRAVEL